MTVGRHLRMLTELFKRGETGFNEEEQVNHIVYQFADQYNLKSIAVLFFTGDDDAFEVFAHRGLSRNFIKLLYSSGEKEIMRAAKKGAVVVKEGDPEISMPGYTFEHDTAYRCAAPLKYLNETLGVLFLDGDDSEIIAEPILEEFSLAGGVIAAYLKVKKLNAQISRVSDIDPLTGLFSFKFFHEALFREITRSDTMMHPMSLLFMEIRNIREMNRVYGHIKGDNAIMELSRRVKEAMREIDIISRSGDNFYIVVPELDADESRLIAEKLVQLLGGNPVKIGEIELHLSMGLVSFPRHGDNERKLISEAERLVHESKRKGGNALTLPDD